MGQTSYLSTRSRAALLAVLAVAAAREAGMARSEVRLPVKAAGETVTVVEYYNAALEHYFITADAGEIAVLDGGAFGGAWKRTGQGFAAWDINGAPAGTVPVCRFFGTDRYRADGTRIGANSHFYTADPDECAYVRTAWQSVASDGQSYPAWTFESHAFAVRQPVTGACPADTRPLHRAYNDAARGDPNHRYSTDPALLRAMAGWTYEGLVMCLPLGSAVSANSGSCLIPIPGFAGDYVASSTPGVRQRQVTTGTADAPVESVTTQAAGATIVAVTAHRVSTLSGGRQLLEWSSTQTDTTAPGFHHTLNITDGRRLTLPMNAGETQSGSGPVTGTESLVAVGISCNGSITGTTQWQISFIGMESVTVPAGTFSACRFSFRQTEDVQATCAGGPGSGVSSDRFTLWFAPGLGTVKTLVESDGATIDLVSYTR